jgi:hypothetical protein
MFIVVKGVAMVFYEDHLGRRTKIDELTAGQSIGGARAFARSTMIR